MRAAIIGSGPSGIAAATALLENGWTVDLVDAGGTRPDTCAELSETILEEFSTKGRPSLRSLKQLRRGNGASADSGSASFHWLGRRELESTRNRNRVLGSKFAFETIDQLVPVDGSDPARSIAAGGLSNVWGAACYGLGEESKDWPPGSAPLTQHYRRAIDFLGVDQEKDGLAGVYPLFYRQGKAGHRNSGSVIEGLLARWKSNQAELEAEGIRAGRSRLAVAFSGENACRNCGLCYAGCPADSIFHSDQRINGLVATGKFRIFSETFVLRFREEPGDTLSLETTGEDGAPQPPMTGYDRVVLAAGALSSFRIAAQSLGKQPTETPLLDNDMILLPFLGKTRARAMGSRNRFALSEAALSLEIGPQPQDHVHAQFYALHPMFFGSAGDILDSLPGWLGAVPRAALSMFLVGLIYLPSHLSRVARLQANPGSPGTPWRIAISSAEGAQTEATFREAIDRIGHSKPLGMIPIRSLIRTTPLGFSGHLGGTLPMRSQPSLLETDRSSRLAGDRRVAVVDASAFPAMPAQNPTLTLVAHAFRVARSLGSG